MCALDKVSKTPLRNWKTQRLVLCPDCIAPPWGRRTQGKVRLPSEGGPGRGVSVRAAGGDGESVLNSSTLVTAY